ncbi:MAG: GMP synthase-like glutamine amidotransferase [Paracoccaceae bacterium]|jgi:GMP synthase-like glutamine amidotransferase
MTHVAIYLTNTDRSEFAARHSNDAFKVIARLEGVGALYDFTVFDVTKEEFPADPTIFDSVIITGSPAYVDDGDAWIDRLLMDIRALVAAKTPLIGLCFGHQAIVAALEGEVEHRTSWIFGGAEFDIVDTRPWMDPPMEALKLYAANKAQVSELPDGFDLLGSSIACPFALSALGDQVFTTQFHPEMDDSFIADLIDEYAEYLGPQTTLAARNSIVEPAQGAIFGQWIRNFIELPRA